MFNIRKHSIREEGYFYYKRSWLYFGEGPYISTDFLLGDRSFAISVGRGSRSLKFHLAIPFLFSFWISFKKVIWYGPSRELSLRFHSGSFWCNLWSEPMDGKTYHFDVLRFIKGKSTYSEETLEERDILIPMPERAYKAKARLYQRTWSYPRWFSSTSKGVSIDMEKGEQIPHEGKGENSWDCGPDATFGMSCPANSIPEAVGKLVGSVLRDRVKYGGWSDWSWSKEN